MIKNAFINFVFSIVPYMPLILWSGILKNQLNILAIFLWKTQKRIRVAKRNLH